MHDKQDSIVFPPLYVKSEELSKEEVFELYKNSPLAKNIEIDNDGYFSMPILKLNEPTLNGRIYTKESFVNFDENGNLAISPIPSSYEPVKHHFPLLESKLISIKFEENDLVGRFKLVHANVKVSYFVYPRIHGYGIFLDDKISEYHFSGCDVEILCINN